MKVRFKEIIIRKPQKRAVTVCSWFGAHPLCLDSRLRAGKSRWALRAGPTLSNTEGQGEGGVVGLGVIGIDFAGSSELEKLGKRISVVSEARADSVLSPPNELLD